MIMIVQNTIEDVPQFIAFTSTPRAEIFCVVCCLDRFVASYFVFDI